MARTRITIVLELDETTDGPAGCARLADGTVHEFHGWLALAAVIDSLARTPAGATPLRHVQPNGDTMKRMTTVDLRKTLLGFALAGASLLAPAAHATAAAKCTEPHGQAYIDSGRYRQAVSEFTCLIDAEPTEVAGYRGRIEADLLLGRYSDALRDYARITARVVPVHPDAQETLVASYDARLETDPESVTALTGGSFVRWAGFDYAQALQLLNRLVDIEPDGVYGNLFNGSSRLLQGGPGPDHVGEAYLERANDLAPASPDVHFIVADAYTYGQPDLERAFQEASFALDGGLDTPRVHAILATAYDAFGDIGSAAEHIARHFGLVTTELVTTAPLAAGRSVSLDIVPGRAFEIPIAVTAGQTITIATSSRDYWDTIAVLRAPDGTPVVSSDDENAYFAAFDWVAEETATYMLRVTFFESVNTGALVVARA